MNLRTALPALALCLCPLTASALTLEFPAPVTLTADETRPGDEALLPMAAFDGADVPMRRAAGHVTRQAWRLASGRMTTLQILAPLRDQLLAEGFRVLFECSDLVCGGFDFRFAADVLGEPAMHVDLGDYRYLLARNDLGVSVALMVSRAPGSGFVQLTRVGGAAPLRDGVVTSTKSAVGVPPVAARAVGPLLAELSDMGAMALDDLLFQTGSADLAGGDFPSLTALAGFLAGNPDLSVTLVGHTDAEGALAGNIALSRRRAEAVRGALIRDHGISPARLTAEGVGYLAPRASNATDKGRRANRRVEVVLNE